MSNKPIVANIHPLDIPEEVVFFAADFRLIGAVVLAGVFLTGGGTKQNY